jgi:hypothetical protein
MCLFITPKFIILRKISLKHKIHSKSYLRVVKVLTNQKCLYQDSLDQSNYKQNKNNKGHINLK